jgi:hypothetical protein
MGMLSDLAEAIAGLDIPVHGESIAQALALRDLLDARIAVAVGEYDHQGLAIVEGATSTTGFIKQCGAPNAVSLVKNARRLRDLPVVSQAWRDRTLTGGQIQAICANVDDATAAMFQETEAELVPLLAPLSVFDTAIVMRQWRARAEARLDPEAPEQPRRTAFQSDLLDGRGHFDASLDADANQLLRTALRLAKSKDAEGETRTAPERRADAFVDIVRFFLDHQHHVPKNRNRPHASIVIDFKDLAPGDAATYTDGTPASPATVKQTLCDAGISRVVTDGRSVILDYGTTVYPFSDAQFHALVLRDQHCRHAGCDRPPEWCEAHHVRPWPVGPTSIANAVLKCSRHHHLGHRPGWTERLEPDGTYHLTAPDGRTWTTTPPGILTRAAA